MTAGLGRTRSLRASSADDPWAVSQGGKLQFVERDATFLNPLKTGDRKALTGLVRDTQISAFRKQMILIRERKGLLNKMKVPAPLNCERLTDFGDALISPETLAENLGLSPTTLADWR